MTSKKRMKIVNYLKNECVLFYLRLEINFSEYGIFYFYITYIAIVVTYGIYGDPQHSISAQEDSSAYDTDREREHLGDTSIRNTESSTSLEFTRHPQDTGESTLRLVAVTPGIGESLNAASNHSQICESASLVSGSSETMRESDGWSTIGVVGVNGDNNNDVITHRDNQALAASYSGEDNINLSVLRHRIDDMIRIYGRNNVSSMLQSDISSNHSNPDNYSLSQETITLFRDVVTNTARCIRPQGTNDYAQLGLLFQQLNEAESALAINSQGLESNISGWSLETNNSDPNNFEQRREIVRARVENQLQQDCSNEVVVSDKKKLEEIKTEINSILSKIRSICHKCKDGGKRKIFWHIMEKYTDRYETYQEYKESWEPDTKLRKEIKHFIRDEVKKLLDDKDPFERHIDRRR